MPSDDQTTVARQAERGIHYGIVAVVVVGFKHRNPGAVVNAIVALLCAVMPGVLERRYDVEFEPWQRVYVKTALFTHSVGMLGPYDDVWWWDHLTHLLSASVLGGVAHVAARRRGHDPSSRVLGVIVTVGVLWELMEYGIHAVARALDVEPLLISYGRRDTTLDFVFDLVGALLVVVFGDRLLDNFLERVEAPAE